MGSEFDKNEKWCRGDGSINKRPSVLKFGGDRVKLGYLIIIGVEGGLATKDPAKLL